MLCRSDVWLKLRPGQDGYTYNGRDNAMLNNNFKNRLDRVLCKLSAWQPESVEMVGTAAIPGASYIKTTKRKGDVRMPVLPSDHYGLLARFRAV